MPEELADVQIEYLTGLRVVSGCAEDIIAVAVPAGSELPAKPGCGFPLTRTQANDPLSTLIDSAQKWIRSLTH